jgi:hypothetical protein
MDQVLGNMLDMNHEQHNCDQNGIIQQLWLSSICSISVLSKDTL